MARPKTNKVELLGFKMTYDLMTASKLLQKDHRTIKKICAEHNIELQSILGRYYITEEQVNLIKEKLNYGKE